MFSNDTLNITEQPERQFNI